MDTLLVAIASVGGITVLAAAVTGLAALGRKLGRTETAAPRIEVAAEVANPA